MTLFSPFESAQNEELRKVFVELKRIAKWYACTIVGVPLLVYGVSTVCRELEI